MNYNLFFAFLFISNGINGFNTKVDMDKLCQENNHSLFIREDIPITLSLTSFNSGLNCSIEVSSNSPMLEFNISSLKLPFANISTCADSVTISSFADHISQKIITRFCREADLLENDIISAPNPANITIIVSSPSVKWNSLDYKFEVTIGTNFIKSLKSVTSDRLLANIIVGGVVVLFLLGFCVSICCALNRLYSRFIRQRVISNASFARVRNEPEVRYCDPANVNEYSPLLDGKPTRTLFHVSGSSSTLSVGETEENLTIGNSSNENSPTKPQNMSKVVKN